MTRRTLAALLAALTIACGGDDDGATPGTDAGSFVPAADGGSTDAGSIADVDAGTTPGTDAGAPVDGGGTAGEGACTNAADQAALASVDVGMVVGDCAGTSFGMEPATSECIQSMTGLSDGCTACFSMTVSCTVQMCLTQCIGGGDSPGCVSCRETNCDPGFRACSGLSPM